VLTERRDERAPVVPELSLLSLSAEETPAALRELSSTSFDHAELLGQRTAELHLALAGDARAVIVVDPTRSEAIPPSMPPAFAPEAYTPFDQRSTYQSMRNQAGRVLRSLGIKLKALPPSAVLDAESVLGHEAQVMKRFGALLGRRLTALRTRYHGDYHLAQVLFTGKDFVIVDLEGDRRRTLPNRRQKGTVVRDLASMIRSYHYAAMTALLDENRVRREDRAALEPWTDVFYSWVSAAFLRGYFRAAAGASFLPKEPRETEILLDTFLLKKAFTELGGELEEISERVLIPLRGITKLLAVEPSGGE
jgi:maltose alpha-D-glucosyltransferase/alpha-amylase